MNMDMKSKLTYDGSINLILGSMWSGKTSELVRRYQRHTIGGRNCLMIKYKNDIRYDTEMVVTHDKIKVKALVCEYLYEADDVICDYDVICIDEVQFYKDAHIFMDKWANTGKIIEASGLNGTFNRQEFPIISKLIPLCENINFLKAVCKETGSDATISNINVDVDDNITEVIGGSEIYNAVDRKTYYKNKYFYTFDLIKDYVMIYAKSLNINIESYNMNNFDDKLKNFINMNNMDLYDMGEQFLNNFTN